MWTARPDDFRDGAALARYRSWLGDDEIARADRYLRKEDGYLFLIAHALLRFALSHYADVAPEGWRFTTGEHGRPRIAADAGLPRLGFSLSHTPGLVACVVSDEIDCGIDVEGLGRVADPRGLARRYFSKAENAELDLLPDRDVDARFVEMWTLKEAYVKARGLGLAIPLDGFSFDCRSERGIEAAFGASVDDRSENWQFLQVPAGSKHLLAGVVRRSHGNVRSLRHHDAVAHRP